MTSETYIDNTDNIPGIFEHLGFVSSAKEAIHHLHLSEQYDLFILATAPWYNPSAWMHKRLWIQTRFGKIFYKKVIITHRKDLLVGGGNSAGQSAVYLSNFAKNVHIIIRKPDLSSSMSSYLIDQIDKIDNIEVIGEVNITEIKGENERLSHVTLESLNGNIEVKEAQALFIFIGNKPYTDWIEMNIMKDKRGFIKTGRDVVLDVDFKNSWKKDREPFLLETCEPGIFASGDVRSGAMNRVASAVGEGAMAIKFVHEYLAEI